MEAVRIAGQGTNNPTTTAKDRRRRKREQKDKKRQARRLRKQAKKATKGSSGGDSASSGIPSTCPSDTEENTGIDCRQEAKPHLNVADNTEAHTSGRDTDDSAVIYNTCQSEGSESEDQDIKQRTLCSNGYLENGHAGHKDENKVDDEELNDATKAVNDIHITHECEGDSEVVNEDRISACARHVLPSIIVNEGRTSVVAENPTNGDDQSMTDIITVLNRKEHLANDIDIDPLNAEYMNDIQSEASERVVSEDYTGLAFANPYFKEETEPPGGEMESQKKLMNVLSGCEGSEHIDNEKFHINETAMATHSIEINSNDELIKNSEENELSSAEMLLSKQETIDLQEAIDNHVGTVNGITPADEQHSLENNIDDGAQLPNSHDTEGDTVVTNNCLHDNGGGVIASWDNEDQSVEIATDGLDVSQRRCSPSIIITDYSDNDNNDEVGEFMGRNKPDSINGVHSGADEEESSDMNRTSESDGSQTQLPKTDSTESNNTETDIDMEGQTNTKEVEETDASSEAVMPEICVVDVSSCAVPLQSCSTESEPRAQKRRHPNDEDVQHEWSKSKPVRAMSYGTLTRQLLNECHDNRNYTTDRDLVASMVYDSFRGKIKKKKIKRRLIPMDYRTPEESPMRIIPVEETPIQAAPEKPPRNFSVEPVEPVKEEPIMAAKAEQEEIIPKRKKRRNSSSFMRRLSNLFGCTSNKGN